MNGEWSIVFVSGSLETADSDSSDFWSECESTAQLPDSHVLTPNLGSTQAFSTNQTNRMPSGYSSSFMTVPFLRYTVLRLQLIRSLTPQQGARLPVILIEVVAESLN